MSKSKSGMMKDEPKRELKPKLRFPEFRDAKEWDSQSIGDFADILKGKGLSKADLAPDGKMSCIRYAELYTRYGEVIATVFARTNVSRNDLVLSKKQDVIIPASGETKEDIATASCVMLANVALGSDLNIIRSDLYGPFFSYYLNGSKRFEIAKVAQGDTVAHLYPGQLKKIEVCFPEPAEQQKIADCLSSLDELIAAHSRKLDALKAHKKGLMQQLFPREGETLPRLRFPEFKNAPPWETATIQELIDREFILGHLDGNHGSLYPHAEEFAETGVPYITANDFKDGYVTFDGCKHLPMERALQFKKGVAKDGDILFAHNATVGPVAKLVTDLDFVILSTTATYFRCDGDNLLNDFLQCALVSQAFVDQYTPIMSQSTRNQVPITAQRKLSLSLPDPTEQNRIAEFLTSLNDLIVAQTKKLEMLDAHKTGLMQQLFPSLEDSIA